MSTEDLASRSCVPCRGGVPPLSGEALDAMAKQVPGWSVVNGHHLSRSYTFPDFVSALTFVNAVGAVAEKEGHHPDIYFTWGKARIEIFTHKIEGLTESDFILAAKIGALPNQ